MLSCWKHLLAGTASLREPLAFCYHWLASAACLLIPITNAATCLQCSTYLLLTNDFCYLLLAAAASLLLLIPNATTCLQGTTYYLLPNAGCYSLFGATNCSMPLPACYRLQVTTCLTCYHLIAATAYLLTPCTCLDPPTSFYNLLSTVACLLQLIANESPCLQGTTY